MLCHAGRVTLTPDDDHELRRTSFGAAADVYAAVRPGWPAETVSWLTAGARELDVLDLGAGTGKLTAALLEAPLRVFTACAGAGVRVARRSATGGLRRPPPTVADGSVRNSAPITQTPHPDPGLGSG
jgi:hypothetical protein